jgi:ATP adenylyltransferase
VARAAEAQRAGGDAGGPPGEEPLFSRISADAPARDRENLVVWRGPTCFAVLNRYPYTNGHLLLLPLREVAEYSDLTPEERHELADLAAAAMRWLREALGPDGFNVGMNVGLAAGAGIPRHLHVHVVPRWTGDTNVMAVVGQTRVIPESLESTWEKLRAVVAGD